jgi:hypothetical protein
MSNLRINGGPTWRSRAFRWRLSRGQVSFQGDSRSGVLVERRWPMKTLAPTGAVAALLLLCGCAATQRVVVTTDPVGAQVTLIRYGVTQVDGSVPGVAVGGVANSFEDPPLVLGTSPLEYEFRLEESGKQIAIAGLFVKVTRIFTEGLIRAEKEGRVAERRVMFSGKPVRVDLTLPPP